MGIIRKYMNQTRKPEGILGNLMITGMNTGHAAMAKWGSEYLRVSDPAAVIDLGCGGGSNIKALAGRYTKAKVTGLDYSELSVERSRAYNSSLINSGRCEIIRGDVSEIDLPDGSLDLATAFETIYFWPELEKCFREVARILGPDGTFMIVNETDGAEGISKQYEKIIDGMKVYTPEEIETALKTAGFDRVTTYRHDSKPWITVIAEKGDAAKSEITETLKPDYRNWVPVGMIKGMCAGTAALAAANAGAAVLLRDKSGKVKTGIQAALGLGLVGCAKMTEWCIMANRAFSYDGERKLSKVIVEGTAEYVNIPEDGVGLDVGCGSGALTIACAKRNPRATMVGIDRWGAEYASFSKVLCERNAKAEGVSNVSFSKGDAVHLDYPDETFDAVTSNYVYHNISGVNKQELLRETLRVLKRGGTFAIHDLMSRARYGDMEGFAQQLRDEGYQEVELIHTDDGLFMSKKEATKMMLRGSTILRGVK